MNKVFKNIFSSMLPQIMNIVANLILPTLLIVKYGSEVNGLVSTTKTIVSYISIIGAGIAAAVTQALYAPVAEKDDETVRGMLHSANKMFNQYGIIYVFVSLIVAVVYPFAIKTEISSWTIAGLLVVMSISGASEFFVVGRCRALLYANQQVYVCTIIQAISIAGSLLFALIMLNLNANIVLVQFAISFVYVLRALLLSRYVRKKYPQYINFSKTQPNNTAIQKRTDAMVHQLSGLAVTGSQAAILTVLIGLEAASIYAVYNIVFSGLQSICSNINTAITPFLGRAIALKNGDRLLDMYDKVEFAFLSIVGFIFSVTAVMILPFVSIYTSDADINYVFPAFAILFVLSSSFYILKMPSIALINTAGHFRETKVRALIEAGLSIGLGIELTAVIGKNGVLIGTCIALGWRCVDAIYYSNKYILHISNKKSFIRLSRTLATILAFCVFTINEQIVMTNYFQWIKYATIVSLIAILVILLESVLFERKTIDGIFQSCRLRFLFSRDRNYVK